MLANVLLGMGTPIDANLGARWGGSYYPGAAIPETPIVNNNPVIDNSGGSSSASTAPTSQGRGMSATGHGDAFGSFGTGLGLLGGAPALGMVGNAIGTGIDRGNIANINSQYGLDPLQSNFFTDMIGNTSLGQAWGVPNSSRAEMAQQNNAGVFGMEDPSLSVEGRTGLPGGINFSTLANLLNAPAPAPASVNNNQIGLNGHQIGQSGPMGTIGESVFGDLGDPGTNQGLSINADGSMASGTHNDAAAAAAAAAQAGFADTDAQAAADAAAASSGNGGGGGGDSGTFVCTELFRQQIMSERIYNADREYGRRMHMYDPDLMKGYALIGIPLARKMKASPAWTAAVLLLARPWSKQMAYEMGALPRGSVFGKLFINLVYPLVRLLGKIHG